jgi:hypothetical protein
MLIAAEARFGARYPQSALFFHRLDAVAMQQASEFHVQPIARIEICEPQKNALHEVSVSAGAKTPYDRDKHISSS